MSEPTRGECQARIVFGNETGICEEAFYCELPKGHTGPHEEKGIIGGRKHPKPFVLTWRTQSLISRQPDVQWGAYCIRGTRTPVKAIQSECKGGASPEFIAQGRGLTLEQVMACLAFRRKSAGL